MIDNGAMDEWSDRYRATPGNNRIVWKTARSIEESRASPTQPQSGVPAAARIDIRQKSAAAARSGISQGAAGPQRQLEWRRRKRRVPGSVTQDSDFIIRGAAGRGRRGIDWLLGSAEAGRRPTPDLDDIDY